MKTKSTSRDYLLKQLPKATAFLNMQFEVVHASNLWLNMFEYSEERISNLSFNHLFIDLIDDGKKAMEHSLKDISGKPSIEKSITAAGEKKWFEWVSYPWYDENENIIGVILNCEDITRKFLNEQRLKKLEILLDQKSEIASIGTWEYNLLTDDIKWDDKTKAIHEVSLGYNPTTSEANDFYKKGYSRNTISMTFINTIKDESPWSEKVQLVTAEGNEIWVINSGRPVYTNGEFTGIMGTIQNINELTLKEIKTKENEYQLRTLIDNLPLNVYIKDLDSKKVLVNKAEIKYCGVKSESELLGKDDFDFLDPKSAKKSRKEDLKVMKDLKSILSQETENFKKDGTKTAFLTSKIPLINTDGSAYGLIGINVDISELKQKEEELRALISVTSLQNEKLVDFAHIISHNLRSHTANFSMLLEFLTNEKNEDEKRKILGMLIKTSNNLLETLGSLNEVVDINSKTKLEKTSVSIVKEIENAERNLAKKLALNKAMIINEIDPRVTVKVIPAYLENIMKNFLTNAINYRSPKRKPIIKFKATSENGYTVISIQDNGLGLDLEKYGDKIFGMNKTFHESKEARGIGLYITKNQIEAMNGKVSVESKVGIGTTFKIYFNENN